MTRIEPLVKELKGYLGWHQDRVEGLALLIIALVKVRSVNLKEVASGFGGQALEDSSYRRLQRFFKEVSFDFSLIARLIVKLLNMEGERWVVILDRTNWCLGQVEINFLTLAVLRHGVAVPLLWTTLPKKGNSNTRERIALMNRFIQLFGKRSIGCLLADREFVGRNWLSYLQTEYIPYCLRVKTTHKITNAQGIERQAGVLLRYLSRGATIYLGKRRIWGLMCYVTGYKKEDGTLVILIRDRPSSVPNEALVEYAQRWKIESLFACLKSRGFRLEETHLNKRRRLKKLTAVLALTFCWAYLVGEWRHEHRPIALKNHRRKARSIFRYGLDFLRNVLLNPREKSRDFSMLLRFLSCT